MKIVISARVEAELERHFSFGVEKFGQRVAERTFLRVRSYLFTSLAMYPYIGVYRAERDIHEAVIPRTPFVVFYRVDRAANTLTVVALFHHAQDRWHLE
jgi:plasmid stabilization system protein ParE